MTATHIDEDTTERDEEEAPPRYSAAVVWAHEKRYWIVALFLGFLTAIEVSTYTFPDFWGSLATAVLLVLMAVKFFTVTCASPWPSSDTPIASGRTPIVTGIRPATAGRGADLSG